MITDRDWLGPSSNGETQVVAKFSPAFFQVFKAFALDNPISD